MAQLRKEIFGSGTSATSDNNYDIPNVWAYNQVTVEVIFSGLTYPAAENDAEMQIMDSENGNTYTVVDSACTDGSPIKLQVTNWNGSNVRFNYVSGSANGGTFAARVLLSTESA